MTGWHLALELAVGVLLTAVAVGISIRVAVHYSAVDVPDGGRKQQERPIPRLGGVAVAIAFTLLAIGMVLLTGRTDLMPGVLGVLVPALGVAGVGYVDDVRGLGAWERLALQALFALTAVVFGTTVSLTEWPAVDALITVVFIVVVVNGVNLLDNSDGLAAGSVLVSAAGATVIAVMFGQALVALLGCALVGVCIGFLRHNWFPARVYLGDAGSYLLGFLLAVLVVRLRPDTVPPAAGVLMALLLVALPLVDTAYVVVRRIRAGVHPFTAGRDHLSHTLQDRGRSVPGSVLALQIVPGVAVLGAVIMSVAISL